MELAGPVDGLLKAASSTSLAITNYVRLVRAARSDLTAVTREISELKLVLELLRDEDDIPTKVRSRAVAVLDSCGVILRRLDAITEAAGGEPTRTRWALKEKSETSRLQLGLQTYREALGLALEVTNLRPTTESGPGADAVDGESIKQEVERIHEEIAELRDLIPQAGAATGDSASVLGPFLDDLSDFATAFGNKVRKGSSPVVAREAPKTTTTTTLRRKSPVQTAAAAFVAPPAASEKIPISPPPPPVPPKSAGSVSAKKQYAEHRNPQPQVAAEQSSTKPKSNPGDLPLEAAGPWFPSAGLEVPYYGSTQPRLGHARQRSHSGPKRPNVSQGTQPYSDHQSRRLANYYSQQPLPELPGSPSRDGAARHLPAHQQQLNHVAQQMSPRFAADGRQDPSYFSRASGQPQEAPRPDRHSPSSTGTPTPVGHVAHLAASPLDQQQIIPPATPDPWVTSTYVPGTPPPSSGSASQRTSLQPSLSSAPSRDTFRSSVSTGASSLLDQLSAFPSPRMEHTATFPAAGSAPSPPRIQYQPTFESTNTERPTTARSSISTKATAIMDKIPVSFRGKKKSLSREASDSSVTTLETAYRNSSSTRSSSTVDKTPTGPGFSQGISPLLTPSGHSASASIHSAPDRSNRSIELIPSERLAEGAKGAATYHLDISPSCLTFVTGHANHTINVWSVTTGSIESSIKYASKVTIGPRSRMYFIKSHALISERSNLVAITTSFGNTIELWNWAKRKKVQSVDHAGRWAVARGDIYECAYAPLAVYRVDNDRIDLHSISRDPGAKKPFTESRRIELKDSGLPFVPKFPELAFSATGPLLIGAAGPRPGAPAEEQETLLMAWQVDDRQDNHRPYMWVIPEHPELSGALPAALASYGSVAVSIWLPANFRHVRTAKNEVKKVPLKVTTRLVLVWDLANNTTRVHTIPNVQACVSPDCRFVAYCDAAADKPRFVVLDAQSGTEVWSGPDDWDVKSLSGGRAGFQQLGDLAKVTDFQFSDDGSLLMVGDDGGGVGVFEVRQGGGKGVFRFQSVREGAPQSSPRKGSSSQ